MIEVLEFWSKVLGHNSCIIHIRKYYLTLLSKLNTMKALVIGATGATGKDLLDQLCLHSDHEKIATVVRMETPREGRRCICVSRNDAKNGG